MIVTHELISADDKGKMKLQRAIELNKLSPQSAAAPPQSHVTLAVGLPGEVSNLTGTHHELHSLHCLGSID
jgi:hypothetical protein